LSQQEKIPFSSFVEFPSKHLYTRTQKTFESRRASLDIYVKKLVEYYELASQFPNDLNEFLELDKQQTTATSRTLRRSVDRKLCTDFVYHFYLRYFYKMYAASQKRA